MTTTNPENPMKNIPYVFPNIYIYREREREIERENIFYIRI